MREEHRLLKYGKPAVRLLAVIVIIGVGLAVAGYLYASRPVAQKKKPVRSATLVEVIPASRSDHQVGIDLMGTVVPAREITLKAKVSGQIVTLSPEFIPGGVFREGDEILQVDPRDYELAVQEKKNALTRAEADLKLEMGRQAVALREWKLLKNTLVGKTENQTLALRQPQLDQAKAAVASARIALEQAELNLNRTRITAPFNAVVSEIMVNLGSNITPQDALAALFSTDEYWIEASAPVDRLPWIIFPRRNGGKGSEAEVFTDDGRKPRQGEVIRLMSSLEKEGRLARVLVSVKDPLMLQTPDGEHTRLIPGDFVHVRIQGKSLGQVIPVPRNALRDNSTVWIARSDETLEIRPVKTVWKDKDTVLVSGGLAEGEKIIVTGLSAPADGMAIRLPGGPGGTPPENSGRKK